MNRTFWQVGFVLLLVIGLGLPSVQAQQAERVSRPGEYRGYSEAVYDDWVRTSEYVPMRDGVRLAVDIFRPAVDGTPVEEPLPLVWTMHRYHRANVTGDGALTTILDQSSALEVLLSYGYIVAAVDVRGGGASFGTRQAEFTPQEANDAYDVTEWFAAQPWCTGNIGMYGLSYLGITQYMAASTQPPHLKAIFPMMAMFDLYTFVHPNGVFNEDFVRNWGAKTQLLDKFVPAAPVDADPDGTLRAEAMQEHATNASIYNLARANPYRDSTDSALNSMPYRLLSPASGIDGINQSGVAVYHLGGWYDMYPRDTLLWYSNLTGPQKIVMTPWSHNGSGGFDLVMEHLRWFDYWLKGIDNGIMDEPPIYYAVMGPETTWHAADTWPLPNQQVTTYYFQAGPSGSVESTNDGLLTTDTPTADGQDAYTVDYTTTVGTTTRWTDGYSGGFGYPDMRDNDAKSLTYTTPPLAADTQITGHPVVHLWVTSTADDGDFFAYLEEVNELGVSTYLTEGVLRASHRATAEAPWNNLGLPFHRSDAADISPLPAGEPVELVFDLQPTSNIFDAGNRIRVTITGADADTFETPHLNPPPTVTLYRSADYPSAIVLPVIPVE